LTYQILGEKLQAEWSTDYSEDQVTLWLLPNSNEPWIPLGTVAASSGTFESTLPENFNPESSKLRILISNKQGFVFGRDEVLLTERQDDPLSIDTKDFMVYPNPVRDELHLKNAPNSIEKLSVYNLSGIEKRIFIEQKANNELKISTGRLPQGTYFLLINDATYRFRKIP